MIRRLIAGSRLSRAIAAVALMASIAVSAVEAVDDGAREVREPAAAQTASPARTEEQTTRTTLAAAVATPAPAPTPTASPAPAATPPAPTPSAVATPSSAPTPAPSPQILAVPACGRYPIVLAPAAELLEATEAAAVMWNEYLGCTQFTMGHSGLAVAYSRDWPGDCVDPEIVACTTTDISIQPGIGQQYDAASVVAHELGHVINFPHESGVPIMDPGAWAGPGTVWCSLFERCR